MSWGTFPGGPPPPDVITPLLDMMGAFPNFHQKKQYINMLSGCAKIPYPMVSYLKITEFCGACDWYSNYLIGWGY